MFKVSSKNFMINAILIQLLREDSLLKALSLELLFQRETTPLELCPPQPGQYNTIKDLWDIQ